ncbi:NUDIX domain-containing protein [Kineosporia sp. NBRC 101731]|uniref:NUDIX domain-containing protein n=1 Tax=Kineosporia sp. NBRC 101731 TaxID=3032199 RepID=UPI0025576CC3|nr:NUDIX domain-containing protein [Kineosporia sp. NBRC 101731]
MAGNDHASLVDVFGLLKDDHGRLLLMKRAGDIPGSGQWALPSGKLEAGESLPQAVRRELHEELGVTCDPGDLAFNGVAHVRPPGSEPRIGFSFVVTRWHGVPAVLEPDLCTALGWFPPGDLPVDTFLYTRLILGPHLGGQNFSIWGWS